MSAVRGALGLVLGLAVAGCVAPSERASAPSPKPSTAEVSPFLRHFRADRVDPLFLVAGARVFDERCSPCHGDRGGGDGILADALPIRPRNYHGEPFKWGTKPHELVATIRGGRSGVMPPFEGALTEREMWAAAYLVWHWIPPEERRLDALLRDGSAGE